MAKKKPSKRTTGDSHKRLDAELLRVLVERAEAAAENAPRGAADLDAMLASEQERIDRLVKQGKGKIGEQPLRAILREVLAAERAACEPPLRVAYLGPENTFSHLAAVHRFGASADLVPVGSIAAVFGEVDRGDCRLGVVPLENSTDGRVSDTLECFAKTSARICGELPLRIHHCLLGAGPRSKVRTVCSKPQALSQCRNWLAQHLPKAEPRPVASTAEAAAMAKKDPTVAAIASERAAAQLGLGVLAANIEDQADNITRFAIIGPEPAEPSKADGKSDSGASGGDKTALMFEAPHQPGALADAMAIFKRHNLNMTWIESFPIPGTRGEETGARYLFFVEFLGHQTQLRPRRAIAALAKKATQLAVLGSYPHAEPIE